MFNGTQKKAFYNFSTSTTMRLINAAVIAFLLSACAGAPTHLDKRFGNAVRQNMAVQVINPDAAGPDESDRIDGQTAERALEAQRTRSVQSEPESLIINVGSGGS
jgi:starvation-inducible outer membrane lipoprotein